MIKPFFFFNKFIYNIYYFDINTKIILFIIRGFLKNKQQNFVYIIF